jgi:hypothetical protein
MLMSFVLVASVWVAVVTHPAVTGLEQSGTAAATATVSPRAPVPIQAPAGAPAQDQRRMVEQRPLVEAAGVVRDAVGQDHLSGLASIVIEDNSVVVWWKGGQTAAPAGLPAVLARAGRIAPVRVAGARYSFDELLAASARVEAQVRTDARFQGIRAAPDGSGLIVKVDPPPIGVGARMTSVLDAPLPDVGVPTKVQLGQRLKAVSREDDGSPWTGGAVVVNPALSVACTAGFGINTPGGPAMLTAAHCGNAGDRFQDGAGEPIGNVGGVDKAVDLAAVPTNAVSNQIYVGGRNSGERRIVVGGGAPFVGETLCQSGNSSANDFGRPTCNLRVQFEGTDSQRLWEARQVDGQDAAHAGDSGGPVYDDRGDGTVIARVRRLRRGPT